MELKKAKITALDKGSDEQGESFDVQFNPTTLRLSLTNKATGGKTQSSPVRQIVGASESTLAVDLIFDTADEGDSAEPVSVRKRTKQLELFLFPRNDQEHEPPRIRFEWGDMIMVGTVDSLTVDFDHFAADGQPLRAKVSLSIKGQDRLHELKSVAPGERKGAPPPAANSNNGPGSSGNGAPAPNAAKALAGESAPDLAARLGLDPSAWRGLQLGGESSLSLSAGAEIGFSAGLNASVGLGVSLGVEAGASVSLEASFGLQAGAGLNAVAGVGAGADLAAGFALSAAGGVTAAIETVQTAKNQAAEQQARSAFKAPPKPSPVATSSPKQLPGATASATISATPSSSTSAPKPPEQKHVPLKATGLPTPAAQEAAGAAPRTPRADPRASGFGFGVPLRDVVGQAADRRAESIRGDVAIKPRAVTGDPPITTDPTTPGWVALPGRDRGRSAANKAQVRLRPTRPCGCGGGCKH